MPFRFFALNRWEVTNFVTFQLDGHHWLENQKAKGSCDLKSIFAWRMSEGRFPLSGFLNMLLLSSLRHVIKVEVTSVCVRGNIERVCLPWITRSASSPSFLLWLLANTLPPNRLPLFLLHYNSKTTRQLPLSRDVPRNFPWGGGCFVTLTNYY